MKRPAASRSFMNGFLDPFLQSPETFRARKAIRKTATRLFSEAGLFICCKVKKNQNNCRISWLEMPSFWRYKENYLTRKRSGLSRNGPLGWVLSACGFAKVVSIKRYETNIKSIKYKLKGHWSLEITGNSSVRGNCPIKFGIQGSVSRKSRELFGPEKPFEKLRPAYSVMLVLSYVVKEIKIKITGKFRASTRLRFEDTKRIMSPENGPKATFDGESSHHLTKVWAREMFPFAEIKGRAVLIYWAFICTFLWEKNFLYDLTFTTIRTFMYNSFGVGSGIMKNK